MTEYRAGQRVRVEWADGTAVEGILRATAGPPANRGKYLDLTYGDGNRGMWFDRDDPENWIKGRATVTILAEPRPDEPTGLGAVVDAEELRSEKTGRTRWVRFRAHGLMALPEWCTEDGTKSCYWRELIDPIVLSEGWTS